jgi:hypothetical protein
MHLMTAESEEDMQELPEELADIQAPFRLTTVWQNATAGPVTIEDWDGSALKDAIKKEDVSPHLRSKTTWKQYWH